MIKPHITPGRGWSTDPWWRCTGAGITAHANSPSFAYLFWKSRVELEVSRRKAQAIAIANWTDRPADVPEVSGKHPGTRTFP